MKRQAGNMSEKKKPALKKQSTSLINPPQPYQLKVEKKNFDRDGDVTLVANTMPNFASINNVLAGSGPNARVGRKIMMKSMVIRFVMPNDMGSIRVVVVYDKQANQPNGSLLLAQDEVFLTNTAIAFKRLDQVDRFVTIVDQLFENQTGQKYMVEIYRKINLETVYSSTPTDVSGEINSGALCLSLVSTTAGIIDLASRIRYTDV